MLSRRLALQLGAVGAAIALATSPSVPRAAEVDTVTLDWAYYNPVSLVLKQEGWLEEELKKDGIQVQWVQSLGSNKALEFLNAGSLDFGSTAGAAALLARINGNPIRTVWVYSKPEWTALVTRPDTGIAKVEDLKGKRVAATKGTDPYIFLLRALEAHGLAQRDISLVLLQHDQGRLALERGDVDAWAGLDPIMAGVINDLIREIVTEMGATAMTITHDMSSVRAIADRVAMLHGGVIRWTGPIAEMDETPDPYVSQFIHGRADGPIESVR